jgi:hypothetical protein
MLQIACIPNSPMKILLDDVSYFIHEFSIETRTISKSYTFDWLSIPRPFQWLVNMNLTQNIKAGLIHDYEFSRLSDVSFMEANKRLRENLDCSFAARWIVWWWVVLFGTFSYKKDSNYNKHKEEIIKAREILWLESLTIKL